MSQNVEKSSYHVREFSCYRQTMRLSLSSLTITCAHSTGMLLWFLVQSEENLSPFTGMFMFVHPNLLTLAFISQHIKGHGKKSLFRDFSIELYPIHFWLVTVGPFQSVLNTPCLKGAQSWQTVAAQMPKALTHSFS